MADTFDRAFWEDSLSGDYAHERSLREREFLKTLPTWGYPDKEGKPQVYDYDNWRQSFKPGLPELTPAYPNPYKLRKEGKLPRWTEWVPPVYGQGKGRDRYDPAKGYVEDYYKRSSHMGPAPNVQVDPQSGEAYVFNPYGGGWRNLRDEYLRSSFINKKTAANAPMVYHATTLGDVDKYWNSPSGEYLGEGVYDSPARQLRMKLNFSPLAGHEYTDSPAKREFRTWLSQNIGPSLGDFMEKKLAPRTTIMGEQVAPSVPTQGMAGTQAGPTVSERMRRLTDPNLQLVTADPTKRARGLAGTQSGQRFVSEAQRRKLDPNLGVPRGQQREDPQRLINQAQRGGTKLASAVNPEAWLYRGTTGPLQAERALAKGRTMSEALELDKKYMYDPYHIDANKALAKSQLGRLAGQIGHWGKGFLSLTGAEMGGVGGGTPGGRTLYEKTLGLPAVKNIGKTVGRALPFANVGLAAADVKSRLAEKDYLGASLGAISAVPGPVGWAGLGGQMLADRFIGQQQAPMPPGREAIPVGTPAYDYAVSQGLPLSGGFGLGSRMGGAM